MSSRYADALAAPAVADACFAKGIATSERCICLNDSHGRRGSLLFVDSQQDVAVKDFAWQLLHSTTLAFGSPAAALELGARVCRLSRENNEGHPSSCATGFLSSPLAHWCCDTALHLVAV